MPRGQILAVVPSFQGKWVDRGAHRSGERDRRGGHEEPAATVVRAVGGEFLEVPHLADEQAHVRDRNLCSGWKASSNSFGHTSNPPQATS